MWRVKCERGALMMSERLRSSCILIFVTDGGGLSKGCHFIKWSKLFNHPSTFECTAHIWKEATSLGQPSLKTQTFLNNLLKHNEVKKTILFLISEHHHSSLMEKCCELIACRYNLNPVSLVGNVGVAVNYFLWVTDKSTFCTRRTKQRFNWAFSIWFCTVII